MFNIRALLPKRPVSTYVAKCGHETLLNGDVTVFECTENISISVNEDGSVSFCLECLRKMTIQCAKCGWPIFIGNHVRFYEPKVGGHVERLAVIHNHNPLQLIACFREECAGPDAVLAGRWEPGDNGKGRVGWIPIVQETVLSPDDSFSAPADDPMDLRLVEVDL